MGKIKNIAFDFGGVILSLSLKRAIRHFKEIGLLDAEKHLDAFIQKGIFGDLEIGRITAEEFRRELSLLIGHEVTIEQCFYAWNGYVEELPKRNLEKLLDLRRRGYKVCLLSNTNPFIMMWARSKDFDGEGHTVEDYFDHLYLSYECKAMKPSHEIFNMMLAGQQASAEETLFVDDSPGNCEAAERLGIQTLCPRNNEDWTDMLEERL